MYFDYRNTEPKYFNDEEDPRWEFLQILSYLCHQVSEISVFNRTSVKKLLLFSRKFCGIFFCKSVNWRKSYDIIVIGNTYIEAILKNHQERVLNWTEVSNLNDSFFHSPGGHGEWYFFIISYTREQKSTHPISKVLQWLASRTEVWAEHW